MLINTGDSPEAALEKVTDELKRAAVDKRHKFRFFSISTFDPENNSPNSRMVVLRSYFNDHSFELYTDYRTQKIHELSKSPIIAALFWDPSKNVQVRLQGSATVHHQTDRTEQLWKSIQGVAKKLTPLSLNPVHQ